MMSTLVLNRAWEIERIVTWQAAMRLSYTGRAEEVEYHKNKFIHTVSRRFQAPAVIRMLSGKIMKNDRVRLSRRNVWARDKGLCQYCNQTVTVTSMTYDHVLPRSRGGKTTWDNIVLSCSVCNAFKGNKTPHEAGMKPQKPVAPRKSLLVRNEIAGCETWRKYYERP